jgi:uncharacterized protein (TIGR00297 family)
MEPEYRRGADRRHLVRMATGSLIVLFRFTSWWMAAVLAGVIVASDVYLHRRILRASRAGRPQRIRNLPLAIYPIAISCLLLLVPDRLDIVAAAWGVLAFGNGMASLVGRRVPGPRLSWNPDKSWAGSAAFFFFGGIAGAFLGWWSRPVVIPPAYMWFSIGVPFVAALAAAGVETIPIRLDPSISVLGTAAAVLWWAGLISEDAAGAFAVAALPQLPWAALANGVLAAAGYWARTLTKSGAACGATLGIVIVLTTGWSGWLLLTATFGMAVATSRIGLQKKTVLGIAEGRGGRRGASNAFANTGIAAAAGVLAATSYASSVALLAFVAALAAAGSDTMASEVGKAWGRESFLFPSLRRVPPGTPGAISMIGTAAGLIGAVALSVVGVAVGLIPWASVIPAAAGATVGAFAESAMGARLENPGYVNNDVLNFLNTAIAAVAALSISKALG